MSTPIITNRAPAPGEIVGVADAVAFSARDEDDEIVRSSLSFHVGAGPAFWEGGVFPEDDPNVDFIFKARVGRPKDPAKRVLLPSGAVQILKLARNQEAIYEWGKLQSPADPNDPIMVEFTLELDETYVTIDGNEYTGVLVGMYINDTGVAVKFFTDLGGNRYIEIHDINNSAASSPGPTYEAAYDWDQSISHTYKLLWHPKLNLVRLYVSVGQDSLSPDNLLIDGNVTDFPSTLPADEIPPVQPVAFFGHGLATTVSRAIWHNAYLYNLVVTPLINGFMLGEQTGFLRTDAVVDYRVDALPRKAERPWLPLPDSFGTINGSAFVTTDQRLKMYRGDQASSYGFFRREPKMIGTITLLDFKIAGLLRYLDPSLGESTGMEVYIDDGVKKVVVALLDVLGTQYVGILNSTTPALLTSYEAILTSWLNEVHYRLLYTPGVAVVFYRMIQTEDGLDQELIATILDADLPASDLPGPGIGFLHNTNTIEALAEMRVAQIRYSTDARTMGGESLPTAQGWTKSATSQNATTDGEILTISDAVVGEALYYYRAEAGLDIGKGFTAEFRVRIDSYEKDGQVSPIRELTGVGVEIDDGGEIYRLMFADAGPDDNKIIFFGTNDDVEQNLLDIRAGAASVQGTYVSVDWSTSHIYRLEKTVGGKLQLYIDFEDQPSIEFDVPVSNLPATTVGPRFRFGNLLEDWKSTSVWKWLVHNISTGYDVSSFTLTSENEVLSRFDHAINVIAEAET